MNPSNTSQAVSNGADSNLVLIAKELIKRIGSWGGSIHESHLAELKSAVEGVEQDATTMSLATVAKAGSSLIEKFEGWGDTSIHSSNYSLLKEAITEFNLIHGSVSERNMPKNVYVVDDQAIGVLVTRNDGATLFLQADDAVKIRAEIKHCEQAEPDLTTLFDQYADAFKFDSFEKTEREVSQAVVHEAGNDTTAWNSKVIKDGDQYKVIVYDGDGDIREDCCKSSLDKPSAIAYADDVVLNWSERKLPLEITEAEKNAQRVLSASISAVEGHAHRLGIEGDHETQVRQLLVSLHEYCGVYAVDLHRLQTDVREQIESGEISSPEWMKWNRPNVNPAVSN